MKKFLVVVSVVLLALLMNPQRGGAVGDTYVTAAVDGAFATPSVLSGVQLNGSSSGFGVIIYADNTAEGDFQTVLAGVSALGTAQNIAISGKVTAGAANLDGSVTFSGTASVDLGDGSVPLQGVPFSVTATTQGLQLVVGATTLAPQTLTGGAITIQ